MLMPAIAFDPVASEAVRFPIRLLDMFTVVPSEIRIPLIVLAALVPLKSDILFFDIVVVVPLDEIPVVAPPLEWLWIRLDPMFADALELTPLKAPVPVRVSD